MAARRVTPGLSGLQDDRSMTNEPFLAMGASERTANALDSLNGSRRRCRRMRFTGVGVDTISGMRGSSGGVAAGPPALRCASRQSIRLAANKHSSTVPDVTAVTVILISLPTAVETTGIGRSVGRNDFGFRFFFAAIGILLGGSGCRAA